MFIDAADYYILSLDELMILMQSGVEKLQVWPGIETTTLDLVSQSFAYDMPWHVVWFSKDNLYVFDILGEVQ